MKRFLYLTYIPIIYFAMIGAFDIGMDVWEGRLHRFQAIFNLAFFIPIVFRNKHVYTVFSVIFMLLWGYFMFASIILAVSGKISRVSAPEVAGVSIFLTFSFLCALCMLYVSISDKHEFSLQKTAKVLNGHCGPEA